MEPLAPNANSYDTRPATNWTNYWLVQIKSSTVLNCFLASIIVNNIISQGFHLKSCRGKKHSQNLRNVTLFRQNFNRNLSDWRYALTCMWFLWPHKRPDYWKYACLPCVLAITWVCFYHFGFALGPIESQLLKMKEPGESIIDLLQLINQDMNSGTKFQNRSVQGCPDRPVPVLIRTICRTNYGRTVWLSLLQLQ